LVVCGGNRELRDCIAWRRGQPAWTHFANMSRVRSDHAAIVLNDEIIVIGGGEHHPHHAWKNGEMVKSGKEFNLQHEAVASCAVIFNETQFLVIGGFSEGLGHHRKVDRYDSEGKYLDSLPELNHGRSAHACTTFITEGGEQAIMVAGGTGNGKYHLAYYTEIYLPSRGYWTEARVLRRSIADKRFFHDALAFLKAALYNKRPLVVGGIVESSKSNATSDEVLEYDPKADSWSLIAKLGLARTYHAIAEVNLADLCLRDGPEPTIISVHPHQLQRTTARTLSLVIENLPNLPSNHGDYICAFSALGKVLMTNATRTSEGVSCTTPRNDLLPTIPSGESHFTSKLSVKNKLTTKLSGNTRLEDGPDLVATDFNFFDCSSFTSCTSCVSSAFPCDWCVDGHRCTHDTSENCRNDILVNGINKIGPSIRPGPAFCPRVLPEGSSEILVASGLRKSIRVNVAHIAQFIMRNRFVCQFNIEGRVTSVNAQLVNDAIQCDEMEFTYTSGLPNITATLAVIWDMSKPLDNPENIHVLVYQCKEMARGEEWEQCKSCLSLDEKYQCGWCQETERCEVMSECSSDGEQVSWLSSNQTCPKESEYIKILVRKEVGNPVDYFNKYYDEYREGFSANGESWLGLDKIHSLTSQGDYKLKIIMTDFDGKKYHAVYDEFKVGNFYSGYRLTVGGFNEKLSTLGDSLIVTSASQNDVNINGMRFSTRDRDQDLVSGTNCASDGQGGWWYNWCARAKLTGQHNPQRSTMKKQIYYYFGGERGIDGYESWAGAEMLLLPN